MNKQEILARRQEAWHLFSLGYTQKQIAEKLNVDVRTIVRDMQQINRDAYEWFNQLSSGQIQAYHKRNFESIELVIHELWKFYETAKDEDKKMQILNQIALKSQISSRMMTKDIYRMSA